MVDHVIFLAIHANGMRYREDLVGENGNKTIEVKIS